MCAAEIKVHDGIDDSKPRPALIEIKRVTGGINPIGWSIRIIAAD
jgi:hypothetical protein